MGDVVIYVENKQPEASPYFVSTDAVAKALRDRSVDGAEIRCFDALDPDFSVMEKARYFIGSGFEPERIRSHGHAMRIVHCTSAGVDKYLPIDWLPEGAAFTNSSGVHAEKGGAFGLMTVLMLCEGVPRHIHNQRLHRWDARLSPGIASKTIVFVGFGALGNAIASRLRPLGPKIIAVTRSGTPQDGADKTVAIKALSEVISSADCVVVSCPLTSETTGMIDAAMIGRMKPGASLFNIARGAVVDNDALIAALSSGHLSGAALDVFDKEPLPAESPLWDVPNLMIFPHISCDDANGYIDRCLSIFAENVKRDLSGQPLLNRVDPEAGY